MFDRWRKLLKAFYNEKKRQFDISKVWPRLWPLEVAGLTCPVDLHVLSPGQPRLT